MSGNTLAMICKMSTCRKPDAQGFGIFEQTEAIVTEKNQPTGAVMVVGGGIAGIQASLDMANAGYRVYLVEEKPAIGGVMASWTRPFPRTTVPCASCRRNWWKSAATSISN